MMKRLTIFIILISLVGGFSGCKFVPFIKYQTTKNDTDLPRFGKYSYLAGENNSYRSAYDVKVYDWKVKVLPKSKEISGSMEIWMDIEENQDSLLFDVWHGFRIDSIISKKSFKYKRKRDLVYLIFDKDLEKTLN